MLTLSDKKPLEKLSNAFPPEVYIREHPPSHYSLKVTSFTLVAKTNVQNYDSGLFKAEGFKWRLSLYPNGDKKRGGADHLSLYLAIHSGNHKNGWEVNAIIKLFVFDQIRNIYFTIQEPQGIVSRFHQQKLEMGFSRVMSLKTFKEVANGYLVNDTCVFGAEVFVLKQSTNWESLGMLKPKPRYQIYKWPIAHFDKKRKELTSHPNFNSGYQNWKVQLHPKGTKRYHGKYLSVYLELVGAAQLPPKRKIYASFKLRVVDQLHQHHHEKSIKHWFCSKHGNIGFPMFMKLTDLHKSAKGFIHKNIVIIEVEMEIVSQVRVMT